MTEITIINGNQYVECRECGAFELLSVAKLCGGLCRVCDHSDKHPELDEYQPNEDEICQGGK